MVREYKDGVGSGPGIQFLPGRSLHSQLADRDLSSFQTRFVHIREHRQSVGS